MLEAGSGVGGTWYWNRYPGARCDVESMEYSYSVLRRAAAGVGLERALRRAAGDPALRQPRRRPVRPAPRHPVRHAREPRRASTRPRPLGDRDRRRRAHHGHASASWRPAASPRPTRRPSGAARPSRASATTPATGRIEPVDFTGKRVGVIGTGSSAIQSIPLIAGRGQAPLRLPAHAQLHGAGAQRARSTRRTSARSRPTTRTCGARARTNRAGIDFDYSDAAALEMPPEERQREYEARWAAGGFRFFGALRRPAGRPAANETAAEFVRAKIRETVRDPAVAELLSPTQHLRLQAAVRRHRLLRDLQPAERDAGRRRRDADRGDDAAAASRSRGREHEVDAIVFATGFDAMTGARSRSTSAAAAACRCATSGATVRAPISALGDRRVPQPVHHHRPRQPLGAHQHAAVDRAARGVDRRLPRASARPRPRPRSRPSADAEDAWVAHVAEVAGATLRGTCSSWYLAPTSRASRASSCPISAASPPMCRNATRSPPRAMTGFRLS